MGKFIDLTNQRFGRLVVVSRAENKGKQTRWNCVCDCGNTTISNSYELRVGKVISCGCYHREQCGNEHRTHGMSKTRLYRIFYKMHERCYKPTNDNYKYYGGLGVKICDEWVNDFPAFKNWSLMNGYKEDLTIDRIDPSKDYEPNNCRWITIQEQQKNRRKRGTVLCQMK